MNNSVKPVNDKVHAKTKVKISRDFRHLASEQLIPVTIHEFHQAATEFPVFFVKNADSEQYQAVAMMGIKPGQNLFCEQEELYSNYIPSLLRYYPFSLSIDPEKEQAFVCINEDSDRVNEEEGEPLFTEDGERTEYLKHISEGLSEYMEQTRVTQGVIELFKQLDILAPMNLNLEVPDEDPININGLFVINTEKVEALEQKDFDLLKSKGLLPVVYAQQLSMQQSNRLARLYVNQKK